MKMKSLIVSAIVATSVLSAPAMAWGPREQGIVTGIAGTLLVQQIMQPRVIAAPAPGPGYGYPPPPPVYYPSTYPGYTYRPMYRMVDIYFPECNCYRSVPVQVN